MFVRRGSFKKSAGSDPLFILSTAQSASAMHTTTMKSNINVAIYFEYIICNKKTTTISYIQKVSEGLFLREEKII